MLAQLSTLDQAENYADALRIAQKYETLVRDRYGEAHFKYAVALSYVGQFAQLARRQGENRAYYQRAPATIAENYFGRDNIAIVPYLNQLVEIYQPTAAELSERAFIIVENVFGPDRPELLPVLIQLGRHTQDYEKQPRILERAHSLAQKYSPEDYDTLAIVKRELAHAYALERPEDAVPLHTYQ